MNFNKIDNIFLSLMFIISGIFILACPEKVDIILTNRIIGILVILEGSKILLGKV